MNKLSRAATLCLMIVLAFARCTSDATTETAAEQSALAVAATTVPQTWTKCSLGTQCNFTGLRDVRMISTTGVVLATVEAFASLPCARYGFVAAGATVLAGRESRCEYGNVKTEVIPNSEMNIAMGQPAEWVVPRGDTGFTTMRVRTGTAFTGTRLVNAGSFRTQCNLARFGIFDPLVYPGQENAGHLHVFFGNTSVTPSSTTETLLAGGSTCHGGTANRTAYWAPALFNTATGKVQTPTFSTFYYKSSYFDDPSLIQPMPAGLHIIAGNKNATGSQAGSPLYVARWECSTGAKKTDGTLPACAAGKSIRLVVAFPQCWDGVNLDSPDHQSHMAYLNYDSSRPGASVCPTSHPVLLPQVTQIYEYPVEKGENTLLWRLTSDGMVAGQKNGQSAHSDWMMAWDVTTMADMTKFCLNGMRDCGVNAIANGTELLYREW